MLKVSQIYKHTVRKFNLIICHFQFLLRNAPHQTVHDGYLSYDGKDRCLLNMKYVLFTYEVLRQFMFHFLMGRYVISLLKTINRRRACTARVGVLGLCVGLSVCLLLNISLIA